MSMDENIKQLLELTRCALKNETYDKQIYDEKQLFVIAQENGLSVMITPLLKPSHVSARFYDLFQKVFLQYTARDIRQKQAIQELKQLFNDNGINHIFLKGSYLKQLYPASFMRTMGDIDVLVQEANLDKVHSLLINNGYTNNTRSYQHDSYKKDKDIYVEVHARLESSSNDKYKALLAYAWDNSYVVDNYEYQLKPEFNLFYMLFHLMKHFNSSGVGLRSILDIGIFVDSQNEFDLDYFDYLLDKSSLRLFFQNILYLNKMLFGFNKLTDIYLTDYIVDEGFINNLINYIIRSGVHGHGKDYNKHLTMVTKKTIDTGSVKKGKVRYIISLLFPNYNTMKDRYRFLTKLPILLPLAWIFRIFNILFKKPRYSIKRFIQIIKTNKNEINMNYEIIKKLGI